MPVQERESEVEDTIEDRDREKNILTGQNFLCLQKLYIALDALCINDQFVVIYTRMWVVFGGMGFRMYLDSRRLKEEEMYCKKLPCVGSYLSKSPTYLLNCIRSRCNASIHL